MPIRLRTTNEREEVKPVNFYEVMDRKGDIQTGTASATDAIAWFRRGLDNAIFVSVWDETSEDDFKLITDKIEVTALVLAVMTDERGRG